MFTTFSLKRMRQFLTHDYHENIRNNRERGVEGLMGTMIGILFLAVVTASFAGVYMAYTVSTAKATANTERSSVIQKESDLTLTNAYIDGPQGTSRAATAGWNILASGTSLTTAMPGTLSQYSSFTYAAQKTLTGSNVQISQWGGNQPGVSGAMALFTAVPKSGAMASAGVPLTSCDWKTGLTTLATKCLVYRSVMPSIVNPPAQVGYDTGTNWTDFIRAANWTSATNYATATPTSASSGTIGRMSVTTNGIVTNASNQRELNYILVVSGLTTNQKLKLSVNQANTTTAVFTREWTQSSADGTKQTLYGTVLVPAGVTSLDAVLDTNTAVTTGKPTVTISQFYMYQTK